MSNIEDDDDDDEVPTLVEVPSDVRRVIPVTILSGFLGSGKTTLLNHILTSTAHKKRIAVIENEFSDGLGIEGMIAKSGVDGDNISNFFELNNGCICCSVKDDLINTLEQLTIHKDRFDYILIETTGMANPGPLITSLWTDSELGSYLQLDGVVCLVDAANIMRNLAAPEVAYEVRQQLCFADRIVINKVDLVTAEQLIDVERVVRQLNSFAQMQRSTYSNVDLDFILSTNSYEHQSDAEALLTQGTSFLQCFPCDPVTSNTSTQIPTPHLQKSISSIALKISGQFEMNKLKILLDSLLYNNGDTSGSSSGNGSRIFRMKGVLHLHREPNLFVLQAVHEMFDLQPSSYAVSSPDDKTNGDSLFVIIGCNLQQNAIEAALRDCLASQ